MVTHIYIHTRTDASEDSSSSSILLRERGESNRSINGRRQSPCVTCQTVSGPASACTAWPVAIHPFASTHQSCPGACQIQQGHIPPETGQQAGTESSCALAAAAAAAAPADGTRGNGGLFRDDDALRAPAAALPARLLRRAEPPGVVVVVHGLVRHGQGRRRQPRALRLHLLPLHRRLEAAGLRPQGICLSLLLNHSRFSSPAGCFFFVCLFVVAGSPRIRSRLVDPTAIALLQSSELPVRSANCGAHSVRRARIASPSPSPSGTVR